MPRRAGRAPPSLPHPTRSQVPRMKRETARSSQTPRLRRGVSTPSRHVRIAELRHGKDPAQKSRVLSAFCRPSTQPSKVAPGATGASENGGGRRRAKEDPSVWGVGVIGELGADASCTPARLRRSIFATPPFNPRLSSGQAGRFPSQPGRLPGLPLEWARFLLIPCLTVLR